MLCDLNNRRRIDVKTINSDSRKTNENSSPSAIKEASVKDIIYSSGEDVFLVVRKDGQVYLFGAENDEVRMMFEIPPGGVSKALWIDAISGDFLVASPKTGVLRIYNAAMPTSKEIIKVSRHGILDMR